jgi:hypothetical protein
MGCSCSQHKESADRNPNDNDDNIIKINKIPYQQKNGSFTNSKQTNKNNETMEFMGDHIDSVKTAEPMIVNIEVVNTIETNPSAANLTVIEPQQGKTDLGSQKMNKREEKILTEIGNYILTQMGYILEKVRSE